MCGCRNWSGNSFVVITPCSLKVFMELNSLFHAIIQCGTDESGLFSKKKSWYKKIVGFYTFSSFFYDNFFSLGEKLPGVCGETWMGLKTNFSANVEFEVSASGCSLEGLELVLRRGDYYRRRRCELFCSVGIELGISSRNNAPNDRNVTNLDADSRRWNLINHNLSCAAIGNIRGCSNRQEDCQGDGCGSLSGTNKGRRRSLGSRNWRGCLKCRDIAARSKQRP